MDLKQLRIELRRLEDRQKGVFLQRFFKTGKGEYAENDKFLGISVPNQRILATKYKYLSLGELKDLLSSEIHEERLVALIILTMQFKKADLKSKKLIVDFYLKNTKFVNNWDLVDLSADKILGEYLIDQDRSILLKLANSKSMWERRISIIATYAFIKKGESEWTLKIAKELISDKNDLIQKATGWMLREVGKRVSRDIEIEYLNKNYKKMGRTALRYSIEHFPEDLRLDYLHGTI